MINKLSAILPLDNKSIKLILTVASICLLFLIFIRSNFVTDNSMHPTLSHGDKTVSFNIYHPLNSFFIYKNSIVVLKPLSKTDETSLIKRVIAKSGDTVEYRQGSVFINGKKTPYKVNAQEGIYIIPNNHIYILGDNTEYSIDSREIGSVPISMVKSVVILPLGFYEMDNE